MQGDRGLRPCSRHAILAAFIHKEDAPRYAADPQSSRLLSRSRGNIFSLSRNNDRGESVAVLAAALSLESRKAVGEPDDVFVRCQRAAGLAGNPQRGNVLALMEMLGDPHPFVRWEAGRALGETIKLYQERPRLGVSWSARQSPTISLEELVGLAREALRSPEAERRAATADALGLCKQAVSIPFLIEALDDPAEIVRASAAAALGRIGDQEPVQRLGVSLWDGSLWVRRAAADALGQIRDRRAVAALREALAIEQPLLVRSALIAALGNIPSTAARRVLCEHLGDDHPEIRWQAIRGLANIGDVRTLSALEAFLADHTPVYGETIANRARDAIATIEGREIGLWNALRKSLHLVRNHIARLIASRAVRHIEGESSGSESTED